MTIHSDNTTMGNGFVLMHRCIKQHWIWSNPKYFQWWLDLIMEANFADKQILVGRKPTTPKRGQLIASLSWLMEELGITNRRTLIGFLKLLEEHDMIKRVTKHNVTIITICNYDKYQIPLPLEDSQGSSNTATTFATTFATASATTFATENNKGNKENKVDTPTTSKDVASPKGTKTKSQEEKERELDKRRNEFYNSLIPFVDTYGKVMIREFYNYWTEMNKSHTKMKFELCRTWETPRRLVTWSKNNDQWKK